MTVRLVTLALKAATSQQLGMFWAHALRWNTRDTDGADVVLVPTDPTSFDVLVRPGAGDKIGQNRIHFDLTTTSLDDHTATVAELLSIGSRHVDIGQDPTHVVLVDLEGNEFCIIEPGNRFLTGCPPPWGSTVTARTLSDALERSARMATGVGSRGGNGDPGTRRSRTENHLERHALMPRWGDERLHFHVALPRAPTRRTHTIISSPSAPPPRHMVTAAPERSRSPMSTATRSASSNPRTTTSPVEAVWPVRRTSRNGAWIVPGRDLRPRVNAGSVAMH
jgi:hypothetical protein